MRQLYVEFIICSVYFKKGAKRSRKPIKAIIDDNIPSIKAFINIVLKFKFEFQIVEGLYNIIPHEFAEQNL